jgi:hypothetical protein
MLVSPITCRRSRSSAAMDGKPGHPGGHVDRRRSGGDQRIETPLLLHSGGVDHDEDTPPAQKVRAAGIRRCDV